MQLRSLGVATDVALIATRGTVADRGDYLVLATPDDPGYYYGNLLVLARAPQRGEVGHWLDVFHREHAGPEIHHVTLEWDGDDEPPTDELVDAGFTVERANVLVATAVAPAAAPDGIEVRELIPEELARATELAYADIADDEPHRRFMQRRGAWKRALVARRLAQFWGAFADGALVGSLGVVPVSTALGRFGRFQDVQVEEPVRRRGIAAALIAAAVAQAPPLDGFAIVAETGSDAARVYERAGFRIHERQTSACRYPSRP
ncbi:MAG TPA: GNAT family N-acetyltransferase [Kofleriaceae bacterium]|jgi:GNAT superfamily N-acetyltransferase